MRNCRIDVLYGIHTGKGVTQPFIDAQVIGKLYGLRRHIRRDRIRIIREFSRLVQYGIKMV